MASQIQETEDKLAQKTSENMNLKDHFAALENQLKLFKEQLAELLKVTENQKTRQK